MSNSIKGKYSVSIGNFVDGVSGFGQQLAAADGIVDGTYDGKIDRVELEKALVVFGWSDSVSKGVKAVFDYAALQQNKWKPGLKAVDLSKLERARFSMTQPYENGTHVTSAQMSKLSTGHATRRTVEAIASLAKGEIACMHSDVYLACTDPETK